MGIGTTMLEINLFEAIFLFVWLAVIVMTAWNLWMERSFKNLVVLLASAIIPVVGTVVGIVVGGLEWARRVKAHRESKA